MPRIRLSLEARPMAKTVLATTCWNGDCPKFLRDDLTEDVTVRGYDPADPTRELDVQIPATDWAMLVSQLPR